MSDKESKKRKKSLEKFDINAEIVVATEMFKAGMFETELREGQIVTYKTARSIQQTNELTPKKSDILIKTKKITKDTHSENFAINAEIVIATELFKAGMFETELKERQLVAYKTARSIQQTNELTPKKSDILIKTMKMTKDTHSKNVNTKKR